MQEADRKLAWSGLFVLVVIGLELAWLIFVGPANHVASGGADNSWLVIFAGLGVFVALLQFFMFWLQWAAMRRGVEDAKEAARAATKQAIVAQSTFESVERPYVFIYGIEWNECDSQEEANSAPEEIVPFFRYTISSEGKLPAVMDYIGVTINVGTSPAESMELKKWGNIATTIMRPGVSERFSGMPEPSLYEGSEVYSLGEYGDIMRVPRLAEGTALYVEVLIQYHGPFTKGHETRASWFFAPLTEGQFAE